MSRNVKRFLCLIIFVASAATADIDINEIQIEQKYYKIVACQENKILVLKDEMCANDLEKIATDKDIKVKKL